MKQPRRPFETAMSICFLSIPLVLEIVPRSETIAEAAVARRTSGAAAGVDRGARPCAWTRGNATTAAAADSSATSATDTVILPGIL